MTEAGPIIERSGAGWSFRYDLSHLPEYLLLQLHGHALPARGQALLSVSPTLRAQTTTPDGRALPTIIDMRGEGRISMDTLKEGRLMTESLESTPRFTVFVVEEAGPDGNKMELFLSMMRRFSTHTPPVVGTLEEAVALVRAYHEQHGPG